MPAKLLSIGFCLVAMTGACDGNNPPATDVVGDTNRPDGDVTVTDTTTTPDVSTQAGTVKALRVEAQQVTCNPDSIVDVNPSVTLNGAVVISPRFDASPSATPNSHDGFYVADADGGAYSGITIRVPVALAAALVPGDVVDLTGQLKEAFCLTEVDVATLTKKTPVTPLAPVPVAAADLAVEAYESMLVKVTGVTVTATANGGVYEADPGDFQVSYQFADYRLSLTDGATYDLTGVLRYAFGKWQLIPRSAADVVPQGGGTITAITAIQGAAVSTSCPNPDTQFVNGSSGLQVQGVVLVGNHYLTATLDGYIISDGTQNPYSAILISVSSNPKTSFVPGDEVKLTGDHQEFYCNTQLRVASIEKVGGPLALPAPLALAKNPSAEDLEKDEGMLVEMSGVVAATYDADKRQVTTDAGVGIDYGIMGPDAFAEGLAIATKTLTTLRGIVRFSRGSYRISPRFAEDMVVAP